MDFEMDSPIDPINPTISSFDPIHIYVGLSLAISSSLFIVEGQQIMDFEMDSPIDPINPTISSFDPIHIYVGLSLAISSSLFIGASFIIKKKALIKLQRIGQVRAGSGGHGYLKEWIWWAGLLSMGIGEAANFSAYAFAPASLVTPLGALSVVIAALLSSKYLNEKLNLLGKIGCFLCILGSTMIVLHAPKEEEIANMDELLIKLQNPAFIFYTLTVVVTCFWIMFQLGPAYGNTNVVVYILLCSAVGSLSVMSCKGLGLALKETINGTRNEMENWLTWVLLFSVILCIMVQMNYLNKSLDLFNTGVVTPVYYVFFTILVITASAILFEEWKNMSATDILGSFCGFATVIVAIFLLNAFKEVEISYNDIRQITRPKRNSRRRETLAAQAANWPARDEETLIVRSETERDSNNYGSPGMTRSM